MPEILKKLNESKNEEAIEYKERFLLNELKSGNISTEDYIKEIDILKKM